MIWQLQAAKQRFSELVDKALSDGPQIVTRRGKRVVVVLDVDEYERLNGGRLDLKKLLLEGPRSDELEIVRDRSPARDAEL